MSSNKVTAQSVATRLESKAISNKALGQMEEIVVKITSVQKSHSPSLLVPHIVVFAGDHGISKIMDSNGKSAESWQMVMDIVYGTAALNVFIRQNNLDLHVIDAGLDYDFVNNVAIDRTYNNPLINQKIALGTENILDQAAMSKVQYQYALDCGESGIKRVFSTGSNVVGFAQIGRCAEIAATIIACKLTNLDPGIMLPMIDNGSNQEHKIEVVRKSLAQHNTLENVHDLMQQFAGFEMVQTVGGMLTAFRHGMLILVDDYSSTVAHLIVRKLEPKIMAHTIFCGSANHVADGHVRDYLGVKGILELDTKLGSGSAMAMSFPVIESALRYINEVPAK